MYVNIYRMRHTAIAFFVLCAMLWQTFSSATPYGIERKAQEFSHQLIHIQASNHHHPDESLRLEGFNLHNMDECLQLEDFSQGLMHHHVDSGIHHIGLLHTPVSYFASHFSEKPHFTDETEILDGFLENPFRPPRA